MEEFDLNSASSSDLSFPLNSLPEYTILLVMSYLQGIYYGPNLGVTHTPSSTRYWSRAKLVVSTSTDSGWYKPFGPKTGIDYSNAFCHKIEQQLRWTSLSALRLTCKRFADLSSRVVPIFSLHRQIRSGILYSNSIPLELKPTDCPCRNGATLDLAMLSNASLSLVTPTEIQLTQAGKSVSGLLKPYLFRSLEVPDPNLSKECIPGSDPEASTNSTVPSHSWYGYLASQIHKAFYPIIIPPPSKAPLAALQVTAAARLHAFEVQNVISTQIERDLMARTSIDYMIAGEFKKLYEDWETQVRFRVAVSLPHDGPHQAPRYLYFKSTAVQSTSFIKPATHESHQTDPLHLSPFFILKSSVVRVPDFVGLYYLCVQTDDPQLIEYLELPTKNCSTIIILTEYGARGVLEASTRGTGPGAAAPIILSRPSFFVKLSELLGFPISNTQETSETILTVQRWFALVSGLDGTALEHQSSPSSEQLDRMYSWPFLSVESPVDGPQAAQDILNQRHFQLNSELHRLFTAGDLTTPVDNSHAGALLNTSNGVAPTHLLPLSNELLMFYLRSAELILDQFRRQEVLIKCIEARLNDDLSISKNLLPSYKKLLHRASFSEIVEAEFQVFETPPLSPPEPGTPKTPLELAPVAMISSFDIQTEDEDIKLRFSHRRSPMALCLSIVAPTVLRAWQWATKHRILLSYFHYGCSPYIIPTPDLTAVSKKYLEVTSVTLFPSIQGLPMPSWTSDHTITNGIAASSSVLSIDDLEQRDGVAIFRLEPAVPLAEWRKNASSSNPYKLPIDLHLFESIAAVLGVPELSSHELFVFLIRVMAQAMGELPSLVKSVQIQAPVVTHNLRKLLDVTIPMRESNYSDSDSDDSYVVMNDSDSENDSETDSSPRDRNSLKARIRSSSTPSPLHVPKVKAPVFPPPTRHIRTGLNDWPHVDTESISTQYKISSLGFPNAGFSTSREISLPPSGSGRIKWAPTITSEASPISSPAIAEPVFHYTSICMMPQFSHMSPEQLRWADYNIYHPHDYKLKRLQISSHEFDGIHPSNVFVDPSVFALYPHSSHQVFVEHFVPFTIFMSNGDKQLLLQLVQSKHANSNQFEYRIFWRRNSYEFVISDSYMHVEAAKSIFKTKFEHFSGCPWKSTIHSQGWISPATPQPDFFLSSPSPSFGQSSRDRKAELRNNAATFESEVSSTASSSEYIPDMNSLSWSSEIPSLQGASLESIDHQRIRAGPTYMSEIAYYRHIPLNESENTLLRALAPASETYRYWARWYRMAACDLGLALDMIKKALKNDSAMTEDRVLTLMEYAELCRASGDIPSAIGAVNEAIKTDSCHPLPWLAKADLLLLCSFQTNDPKIEIPRIDQSLSAYRRFLSQATKIHALSASQTNGQGSAKDSSPEYAFVEDKQSKEGAQPWNSAIGTNSISSGLSLLVASHPSPPSLLQMRRARLECGKLLQRLGRYEDAKTCYDDLLRKYFKRERLELTLDRSAVLLALGAKPREVVDSIEHALKKETAGSSVNSPGLPQTYYSLHASKLRSRAYLLLSAAYLRMEQFDLASTALKQHFRIDAFDPRAQYLHKLIRRSRQTKSENRNRRRNHAIQQLQQFVNLPQQVPLNAAGDLAQDQAELEDNQEVQRNAANQMAVEPDARPPQAAKMDEEGIPPEGQGLDGNELFDTLATPFLPSSSLTPSQFTVIEVGTNTPPPQIASSSNSNNEATPSDPKAVKDSSFGLRRPFVQRTYAPWEIFSALIENMFDLSSMKKTLLPPALFKPFIESPKVSVPEQILSKGISILENIRSIIQDSTLPDPPRSKEETQRLVEIAEQEYFETFPSMRRFHVSYFVGEELKRLHMLTDAAFAYNLLNQACEMEALHDPSTTFKSESFITSIMERSPDSLKFNTNAKYDIPQNIAPWIPIYSLLHLISQHVTFTIVDRRSSRGINIANAAGNSAPHLLRIVAITPVARQDTPPTPNGVNPTENSKTSSNSMSPSPYTAVIPSISSTIASLSPSLRGLVAHPSPSIVSNSPATHLDLDSPLSAPHSPLHAISRSDMTRNGPATLLWIYVPYFSLPRILVEGVKLGADQQTPALTFSAALYPNSSPSTHVALLVEVHLGRIHYCGPEQKLPPPGFDSLAIVKKFAMVQEDDGTVVYLPHNTDSSAPLYKIFQQDQIGAVRYLILTGRESDRS